LSALAKYLTAKFTAMIFAIYRRFKMANLFGMYTHDEATPLAHIFLADDVGGIDLHILNL
jgi:hypothetical protein